MHSSDRASYCRQAQHHCAANTLESPFRDWSDPIGSFVRTRVNQHQFIEFVRYVECLKAVARGAATDHQIPVPTICKRLRFAADPKYRCRSDAMNCARAMITFVPCEKSTGQSVNLGQHCRVINFGEAKHLRKTRERREVTIGLRNDLKSGCVQRRLHDLFWYSAFSGRQSAPRFSPVTHTNRRLSQKQVPPWTQNPAHLRGDIRYVWNMMQNTEAGN